jgi:hypothetical protein
LHEIIPGNTSAAFPLLATVADLVERYRPDVLAYEKTFYVQQKTAALLHVQEIEIARVGRSAGLAIVGYSPSHVRKVLCKDGRVTKQAVADRSIGLFPELCLRLQWGCSVRGWVRDGLGTGARGRGARARRALMSTTRSLP